MSHFPTALSHHLDHFPEILITADIFCKEQLAYVEAGYFPNKLLFFFSITGN